MTLPVLALRRSGRPDPLLDQLVLALRRWMVVRDGWSSESADAWLIAASCGMCAMPPEGSAVAVWVDLAPPDPPLRERAAVLVGPSGTALPPPGLLLPPAGRDVGRHAWMPPLVRQRWRLRLGLQPHLLVRLPAVVSPSLLRGELRWAAAVVAHGDAVVDALTAGAPVVTDARTAARLGLPSDAVEVARPGHEAEARAQGIARDLALASRLSWRGRRHAEAHHDVSTTAAELARRLGLLRSTPLLGGAPRRLAELWSDPATAADRLARVAD